MVTSVLLEVLDPHKGLVRAPAHCPFKRTVVLEHYGLDAPDENGDIMAVHASLCSVCRLCAFSPLKSAAVAPTLSLDTARDIVQRAIFADQPTLASIMKQIRYLQTKDRSALVVLMSFEALQGVIFKWGNGRGELALNRVVASEGPICMISGVPLYFSQLLTRSPVQVVGEVEWL